MGTRKLAWSKKDIRSFFSVESGSSPCLSVRSPGYCSALDNHNRECERYIISYRKDGFSFQTGVVKDSEDGSVDRKVRGFVLSQENVNCE